MRKVSPKESTPEPNRFLAKRPSVTKIEDRLVNFELKSSTSESSEMIIGNGHAKKDLPKVDILKRREMFERETTPDRGNRSSGDFTQAAPMMSIKERLSNLERQKEETGNHNSAVASNRLSGDITSIKDRLKNLEKEKSQSSNGPSGVAAAPKFDVPLGGSIKDRLSSLHSATTASGPDTTTTTVPATTPADAVLLPASGKAAVVVGMAKKPRPVDVVVEIDQVVEVETLQIEIEQIQLTNRPGAQSLMTQESSSSIQDAVQDYGTIMQDVKEKEEYREITDEDLFGGTDIEMEIDSLQQDMSVSSPTTTTSEGTVVVHDDDEVDRSDSLEDVSQLVVANNNNNNTLNNNTNGAKVIDTLTILGNLLERSASNSNVAAMTMTVEVTPISNEPKDPQQKEAKKPVVGNCSKSSSNSNCNANPRPAKTSTRPLLPQSRSENSVVASPTTNRGASNNNNHQQQQQLKSSQSAFFDTNSGDRYCILLINNGHR